MITSWSIGFNLYAYIRFNLERGDTIFQLGSGSIDDLLKKDYNLISVEHDKKYLQDHCIYAPIKNGWYDLIQVPVYDLLLIDGPPEKIGRAGVLNHLHLFDLSKPIIIDDTHRKTEMMIASKVAKLKGTGLVSYRDQHRKEFAVI